MADRDAEGRAGPPRALRWIIRIALGGPHSDEVAADLDELFDSDMQRGRSVGSASVRYGLNGAASAWRLAYDRRPGLPFGASIVDVRLGLRMLLRQPLLTGVAVVALGLGIPASLSPIHVWSALIEELPFDEPDRLVGVRHWDIATNNTDPRAIHAFERWSRVDGFQGVAGISRSVWNVGAGDGTATPVDGPRISAGAFTLLRVPPLLGRTLRESDDVPGAPDVVVIGESLWEARFGRDPDIIGTAIRIGADMHTVVGIMPAHFRFPVQAQLWLPLRLDAADFLPGEGPPLTVFGRLADGVSVDAVRAEIDAIGRQMAAEFPETHARRVPQVVPMPVWAMGLRANPGSEPDLLIGQALCFLLLLIVCGNVGTMILARTAARSGEIAVRTALGASRRRIVGQLFVESLVLALAATGIGLLVGHVSAVRFQAMIADQIPYWIDLGLSVRTAGMALGLAAICAVVAGVLPALRATSSSVRGNLQRTTGGGATLRFGWFSSGLIVTEVALSIGFLAFGAALLQSVVRDTTGRLGVNLEENLYTEIRMPSPLLTGDWETFRGRFRDVQLEIERRLRADAGVRAVVMGENMPGTEHFLRPIEVEGIGGEAGFVARVHRAAVDVDFFSDLDHEPLAGRVFGVGDLVSDGPGVDRTPVVVNTGFVEHVLAGRSAVGRRFRYLRRGPGPGPWHEIVGVVGPLGMNPLNPANDWGVYHAAAPGEIHPVRFLIETGPDPAAFIPRLRELVAEVDPSAMVGSPRPLADRVAETERQVGAGVAALILLSVVAILLSVAGLYALMSFTVTQRTREIGIRTALGARPREIVSTVIRRAALQLMMGVGLGVAGSWLMLWQLVGDPLVRPQNPVAVLIPLALGTLLVGGVACVVPTLRGLRIQPTEALREG